MHSLLNTELEILTHLASSGCNKSSNLDQDALLPDLKEETDPVTSPPSQPDASEQFADALEPMFRDLVPYLEPEDTKGIEAMPYKSYTSSRIRKIQDDLAPPDAVRGAPNRASF